ncbi:hypothetical protein Syun_016013 [Stephania yunnanensis]|uniref:Uncharacterized protein n=1 Tax=Stephania yunnanensis TaxID=152371 RepID=A0AAP0J6R6_9MAGN
MGGHKSEDYEKNVIPTWEGKVATPRSILKPNFVHRNLITWLFLVLLMFCILYSSNIILNNEIQECITTEEHLSELLPSVATNLSSKSKPLVVNQTKKQEQKKLIQSANASRVAQPHRFDTELKHIMFCIAGSSNLWNKRKEYIKQWWRPRVTRGMVWLDKSVKTGRNEGLPEIRISSDTSKFPYTNRQGKRSALRISRVVSEAVRLGLKDVRWFVMGDDDTVFVVDNVVRVLQKYDHTQYYYIGSSSESHVQNIFFSYSMAYGGGGFAISYPLAKALEKMQDKCMNRYPSLYGSDDRIQACMSELGVPLTRESGFHQYDVYGNLLGLLGAHPVTPLVSMHHLDVVDPIFPHMSKVRSIQHLFQSVKLDSSSILQQSICYDRKNSWSISISWGYVVQIIRGVMSPRELEMPTRTFLNWYRRADYTAYAFNTRPVTKHPCQKPYVFYIKTARYDRAKKEIIGIYARHKEWHPYCRWKMASPDVFDSVVIIKKPDPLRWQKV